MTAAFGQASQVNEAKAYGQSFGPLAHKSTYYDPIGQGVDMRNKDPAMKGMTLHDAVSAGIQKKALETDTGGAGTAGNALVPVYVDSRIVDLSRKYTPWTEMVPRVTNRGTTADYNEIQSKGDAVFAAESAALSEQDDTEDRQSEQIKYLYAKGKVSGPMQAAMPSYMLEGFTSQGDGRPGSSFGSESAGNAKQYQILKRARAFREREEKAIWRGDSSTNSVEFNGIVKQQGSTNQTDKSGATIGYDDTEAAIEDAADAGGRPNVAGAPFNVIRQLREIMIDTFNYRPADMTSDDLPFGVSGNLTLETQVGPVPVVPSQFMDTSANNLQLFFLDMNYIEMRTLMDMTYEDKPDEDDTQVFLLKAYETLLVRAPDFNAFVDNIAAV